MKKMSSELGLRQPQMLNLFCALLEETPPKGVPTSSTGRLFLRPILRVSCVVCFSITIFYCCLLENLIITGMHFKKLQY